MPWKESRVLDERVRMVLLIEEGESVSEESAPVWGEPCDGAQVVIALSGARCGGVAR